MKRRIYKTLFYSVSVLVIAFAAVNAVQAATGYVGSSQKWAWGTNIGWINFSPTHGGVTVYDDHLEGYVWAENVGWIRLGSYEGGGAHTYANDAAGNYGVNNDGAGNLSGYAWGTNIGWINFNPTHGGVTVDAASGAFDGYAWAENIGWISFKGGSGDNAYQVSISTTLQVLEDGVFANEQLVKNGAILYGNIHQLLIEFSGDVYNPGGSSHTDDVTNPDNYLLFQAGEDAVFNTVSCSAVPGVDPQDVEIAVGPVLYSNGRGSGPYVATVTLNSGVNLPAGEYRMLICGSTSIVDLNGVALAGDGVTSGTDKSITFSVSEAALPETGFPQGQVTILPAQPAANAYDETDMLLEIPKLNVSTTIIGVPLTTEGWDVTWLGDSAGYLDGSAFPTWEGNTVITGHVWDAYNQPGLFADLKNLQYGDQFQIKAWGATYTYEVRENKLVSAGALGEVMQSEDYDWVTLVTCEYFNSVNEDYLFRRMVRAVLVEVK